MFDLLGYLIVALIAWHFPQPKWAKVITDWLVTAGKTLLRRFITGNIEKPSKAE